MARENSADRMTSSYLITEWSPEDIPGLCKLEAANWKPWLADGEESLLKRMAVYPQGQLLIRGSNNQPIASISTNRVSWTNAPDISGLPLSWDYCAGKSEGMNFEDVYEPNGNAIVILVINIDPQHKGSMLPSKFIDRIRDSARKTGAEYIIGPFRPSGYGSYKQNTGLYDFMEYCNTRRTDGERIDPWLRAVERNGGVFYSECHHAMNIGPVDIDEVKDSTWEQKSSEIWECCETGHWIAQDEKGRNVVYTESNIWGGFGIESAAPQFPNFRSIELTDKSWIEKLQGNLNYICCDMQFFGRWIWSAGSTRISDLHGNIVFELPHGYSFLGNENVSDTLDTIFSYQVSMGMTPGVVSVPTEQIASSLEEIQQKYVVTEQRDSFDYVYDIAKVARLEGGEYSRQRSKAQKFLRENPNVQYVALNLSSPSTQEDILSLYNTWAEHKRDKDIGEINEELVAIRRLLLSSVSHRIVSFGLYDKGNLIGFGAGGVANSEWIMSYFRKADISYSGIYQYLEQMIAQSLHKDGYRYINREYDMGISGLRESKMLWRPEFLLRKVAIAPRNAV